METGSNPSFSANEEQNQQQRSNGWRLPIGPWFEPLNLRSLRYLGEQAANGKFLGADGTLHEPTTSLAEIAPFEPDNKVQVVDEVIFVNGILTDTERHSGDAQKLANTGARVYAFRNASFNVFRDLLESAIDKYPDANFLEGYIDWPVDQYGDLISLPAHNLAEVIRERIVNREPIHLVGHSQGAIIIGRALRLIQTELLVQGLQPEQVEQVLAPLKVETYGGAETDFVDGPQYVHVDNALDPVSIAYGLGKGVNPLAVEVNPGKGAVTFTFRKLGNPFSSKLNLSLAKKLRLLFDNALHGPGIYFPERRSFAEMRAGNFGQNTDDWQVE